MDKHTPEGWIVSSGLLICDKNSNVIANCCAFMVSDSVAMPLIQCEANARRIVACVNACKGIATEDLEQGVSLQGLINALKESRNELLEACELAYRDSQDEWRNGRLLSDTITKLSKAISKTEGKC